MPPIVNSIFSFLGFLLSALGFLVFGFALGRFVFESYRQSEWQVRIALVLGLFGLVIGVADFTSPGSTGAFVLGAGGAYLATMLPKKSEGSDEDK